MSRDGPSAQRRMNVRRILLLIVAASCIGSGSATLRNDAGWSGWLAVAIGVGLLLWLATADLRHRS